MNTYDEGIYELLTKGDNFKNAWELSEKLPPVKDKFIETFWRDVYNELKERVKGLDFELGDNAKYGEAEGCFIFLKGEERIAVAYDNHKNGLEIGIWIDNDKIGQLKSEAIRGEVNKILDSWQSSISWPAYQATGDNFSTIQTLVKAIPDRRDGFVKETANRLIVFAEEHKSLLLRLVEIVKNQQDL